MVVGGWWLRVHQLNLQHQLDFSAALSQYFFTSRACSPNESKGANPLHSILGMSEELSFRRLDVWKEAMTLVEEIYVQSRRFPADERFGLTSQLRRAAVSVPSNIGEGARRKRHKVHLNHLDIALGSQGEVEVQLEIAFRLGYCTPEEYERVQRRVARVGRMLNGLIASLQTENDELEE